jgi:hypothetical protein
MPFFDYDENPNGCGSDDEYNASNGEGDDGSAYWMDCRDYDNESDSDSDD